MRSSELAELAGVTVRTLRHYHALGLMPEPPRGANGYRSYGATDLVLLMRIKRLASLGFPLERIKGMLVADAAGASGGAADELDALDRELAARIEQLEAQRAVIAELKRTGAAADVATPYAPFLAAVSQLADSAELVSLERDTLVLADSLLPDELNAFLAAYHAEMLAQGSVERYVELNERYVALDDRTPAAEREVLVAAFADFLAPLVMKVLRRSPQVVDIVCSDRAENLLLEFDRATLNPVQARAADDIERQVVARLVEEVRGDPALSAIVGKLVDPDVTS